MRTKNLMKYLMVAATVSILFTSCRKKEDDLDRDTSSASDNTLAEGTFNDVNNIADEAASGNLTSYMTGQNSWEKDLMSSCATVVFDTVATPHTITIDFGPTNCMCHDGRYRRGIINVSYSGHYRDSASTHTITFNNYYVNDNKVMGTKTVTNNGHNGAGHLTYSINVSGQIVRANGNTITWTSSRTREWIAGENTLAWNDDVYLITGSASGTSAAGNSFTVQITSPLRRNIGCNHFVSGVIVMTPANKPTRVIDFGNGACDDQATVTINGTTYNITLH